MILITLNNNQTILIKLEIYLQKKYFNKDKKMLICKMSRTFFHKWTSVRKIKQINFLCLKNNVLMIIMKIITQINANNLYLNNSNNNNFRMVFMKIKIKLVKMINKN